MIAKNHSIIRYNHHGKMNASVYGAEHQLQLYNEWAEIPIWIHQMIKITNNHIR